MTRFARLMAATMAALFTGALAAPAYATGGGCDSHSAIRTFSHSGCKAEGTKFNDLDKDGKRDAGEPGLAGFRIWADYDNDGVLDSGEPYDDTDASGKYAITNIDPPSSSAATRTFGTSTKTYRLREKLGSGSGTGEWTCSYPNASTSGGFAAGNGSDFRCGHGPIDTKSSPKATGKDFGNHRKVKPKITVIKALVPSSDAGRFDLKVDGTTVKAAAGDGGTGSTLVDPGHHQVTETAASGTTLADYAASISCLKNGRSAATARTYGPGWVDVDYGDEVVCTVRNVRLGTVEVEKQTDPDETNGTSFGFTSFAGAFSLADDGVKTITRVTPRDQPYAVSENTAKGYRLSSISCTDGDSTTSVANRTANIKVAAGEKVRCTFVNTKLVPGLQVVKDGPAVVHHGDTMTFTFAVSNTGNSPLRDVHVTDDHCDDVSAAPVERRGDDGDALLEGTEVWVFSCTMPVPAHATSEEDPVCNVATATGEDEEGTDVTASDEHCTDIIHPRIALDKTADRATASVGDTIAYRFDVTNPGDVGLAVTKFEDPRCDAGTVTGPQKVTGDADGSLEPGELWRWRCTHKVTSTDPDPLPNTAKVTGVDPIGDPHSTVTAEDSASVDLFDPPHSPPPPEPTPPAAQPAGQVQVLGLTQRPVSGRASLRGASGCVSRPFRAVVSGRQIRRVTFFVDGKRVARRTARGNQRSFTARIRPARLGLGVHRVTARVVFRTASGTRPRTLLLSFQRCGSIGVSPRFTG
jgi:uncharacterized repeat protein (TIGR01451 family)